MWGRGQSGGQEPWPHLLEPLVTSQYQGMVLVQMDGDGTERDWRNSYPWWWTRVSFVSQTISQLPSISHEMGVAVVLHHIIIQVSITVYFWKVQYSFSLINDTTCSQQGILQGILHSTEKPHVRHTSLSALNEMSWINDPKPVASDL